MSKQTASDEKKTETQSEDLTVSDIKNAISIIDVLFTTLSKSNWETVDQLVEIINGIEDEKSKTVSGFLVSRELGLDLNQVLQIRQVRERLAGIVTNIESKMAPAEQKEEKQEAAEDK